MSSFLKPLFLVFISLYCGVFASQLPLLLKGLSGGNFWLHGGVAGVFLVVYLFLRGLLAFWEIFFHELAHAFFALIFLNRTMLLAVTPASGMHGSTGSANFFISLAPYWFPLHTALLVGLSFLISWDYRRYWDLAIAASYTWHLICILKQFSFQQPDITTSGRFFSLVFVVVFNLVGFFFILAVLAREVPFFLDYLGLVFRLCFDWHYLKGLPPL